MSFIYLAEYWLSTGDGERLLLAALKDFDTCQVFIFRAVAICKLLGPRKAVDYLESVAPARLTADPSAVIWLTSLIALHEKCATPDSTRLTELQNALAEATLDEQASEVLALFCMCLSDVEKYLKFAESSSDDAKHRLDRIAKIHQSATDAQIEEDHSYDSILDILIRVRESNSRPSHRCSKSKLAHLLARSYHMEKDSNFGTQPNDQSGPVHGFYEEAVLIERTKSAFSTGDSASLMALVSEYEKLFPASFEIDRLKILNIISSNSSSSLESQIQAFIQGRGVIRTSACLSRTTASSVAAVDFLKAALWAAELGFASCAQSAFDSFRKQNDVKFVKIRVGSVFATSGDEEVSLEYFAGFLNGLVLFEKKRFIESASVFESLEGELARFNYWRAKLYHLWMRIDCQQKIEKSEIDTFIQNLSGLMNTKNSTLNHRYDVLLAWLKSLLQIGVLTFQAAGCDDRSMHSIERLGLMKDVLHFFPSDFAYVEAASLLPLPSIIGLLALNTTHAKSLTMKLSSSSFGAAVHVMAMVESGDLFSARDLLSNSHGSDQSSSKVSKADKVNRLIVDGLKSLVDAEIAKSVSDSVGSFEFSKISLSKFAQAIDFLVPSAFAEFNGRSDEEELLLRFCIKSLFDIMGKLKPFLAHPVFDHATLGRVFDDTFQLLREKIVILIDERLEAENDRTQFTVFVPQLNIVELKLQVIEMEFEVRSMMGSSSPVLKESHSTMRAEDVKRLVDEATALSVYSLKGKWLLGKLELMAKRNSGLKLMKNVCDSLVQSKDPASVCYFLQLGEFLTAAESGDFYTEASQAFKSAIGHIDLSREEHLSLMHRIVKGLQSVNDFSGSVTFLADSISRLSSLVKKDGRDPLGCYCELCSLERLKMILTCSGMMADIYTNAQQTNEVEKAWLKSVTSASLASTDASVRSSYSQFQPRTKTSRRYSTRYINSVNKILADSYWCFAEALEKQGNPLKAFEAYKNGLDVYQSIDGEDQQVVAKLMTWVTKRLSLCGVDDEFWSKEVLRYSPDDEDVLFNLAKISLTRSRVDEAKQYLERIIDNSPNHTDASLLLGELSAASNSDVDSDYRAYEMFAGILADTPAHPQALPKVVALLRRLKRLDEAWPFLERAVDIESPVVLYSHGVLYRWAGLSVKAQESFYLLSQSRSDLRLEALTQMIDLLIFPDLFLNGCSSTALPPPASQLMEAVTLSKELPQTRRVKAMNALARILTKHSNFVDQAWNDMNSLLEDIGSDPYPSPKGAATPRSIVTPRGRAQGSLSDRMAAFSDQSDVSPSEIMVVNYCAALGHIYSKNAKKATAFLRRACDIAVTPSVLDPRYIEDAVRVLLLSAETSMEERPQTAAKLCEAVNRLFYSHPRAFEILGDLAIKRPEDAAGFYLKGAHAVLQPGLSIIRNGVIQTETKQRLGICQSALALGLKAANALVKIGKSTEAVKICIDVSKFDKNISGLRETLAKARATLRS